MNNLLKTRSKTKKHRARVSFHYWCTTKQGPMNKLAGRAQRTSTTGQRYNDKKTCLTSNPQSLGVDTQHWKRNFFKKESYQLKLLLSPNTENQCNLECRMKCSLSEVSGKWKLPMKDISRQPKFFHVPYIFPLELLLISLHGLTS